MQKSNTAKKEFLVNTTFSDNMVLQRDKKVRIFGYGGEVGEQVTVKFGENTYIGNVDENGWEVWLSPMKKDKTGKTLEVIYKDKIVSFQNVVVGEVWLCGGQSNMEVTVQYILSKNQNVKNEFCEYENWENIRIYSRNYNMTEQPVIETEQKEKWQTAKSFEDILNSSASAIAFASNLSHILGDDVPVGVLNCSAGGSPIESWISPEGMKDLNSFFEDKNSSFYNGMLYNIYGFTFGGLFWYQGCANAQPRMSEDYKKQFRVFRNELQTATKDESLPIVLMQIVQFEDWCCWTNMRQTQWDLMEIPNVYTICGIDLGSNITPHSVAMEKDGLHPTDKWAVGKRAAGVVAEKILHLPRPEDGIPYGISPSIEKAVWKDGKIYLTVKNANKLTYSNGEPLGFEVLSKDEWSEAKAEIQGTGIILTYSVEKPRTLRYLQSNVVPDGVAFIRNEFGLPLAPAQEIEIQ